MKLKLSLWHCLVLYVVSGNSAEELADYSGIDIELLQECEEISNWQERRESYLKLKELKIINKDLALLEALLGKFACDAKKRQFIEKVIENSKKSNTKSSKYQNQKNILLEFGMDKMQAENFIKRTISIRDSSKSVQQIEDILETEKIDLKDKLDTFNFHHKSLAVFHKEQAVELDIISRETLNYYYSQLLKIQELEKNGDDEQRVNLINEQRNHAYLANTIIRLSQLRYETTGLKQAGIQPNAIAKLKTLGYTVLNDAEIEDLLEAEVDEM